MSAPLEPEEDKLPYGRLAIVAALALGAFVLGGLWSTYLLYRPTRELLPEDHLVPAREIGKAEVGIVDQRLFAHERDAQRTRREQEDRLHSYGWVDRSAGLIHIPIEQAMSHIAGGKP